MEVKVKFSVQEDDLIAILDLLSLLSVLVTRKDLEIDGGRQFLHQLHLVAGFLYVSACFLAAQVHVRVLVV